MKVDIYLTRLKEIFLIFLMVITDIALYNLGVVLAFYVRFFGKVPDFNFWSYRDIIVFVMIIPALSFFTSGVYTKSWKSARAEDFLLVFRGCFVAVILLLTTVFIYRTGTASFPSLVIFMSFFTTSALTVGWRFAYKKIYDLENFSRDKSLRTLLVGTQGVDKEILRRIRASAMPRYNIFGSLCPKEHQLSSVPWLGEIERTEELLANEQVEYVLLSSAGFRDNEVLEIIRACESVGVPYMILPSLFDMIASRSAVDLVNYIPFLRFGQPTIEGWQTVAKRILDASVSLAGLILLSWLFGLIYILIKLDSKGKVIFGQTRIGKNGSPFKMYKFRTMVEGADENGTPLTQDHDQRITRVGRYLRQMSWDEFPQLWNVLLGDMSLVGPRAVIPFVADHFNEWERMTLNVLPGMTGLAQVSGRDELGFRDKSMLNIYYIRNYSFFLDLRILFKTIWVVITQEGTEGTRIDQ